MAETVDTDGQDDHLLAEVVNYIFSLPAAENKKYLHIAFVQINHFP